MKAMRLNITGDSPPILTGSYFSNSLKKDQPFSYIVPESYSSGDSDAYPLIVLLHGRDSHHYEWAKYTRLERYAATCEAVFVCPEGGNGWYTNSFDGNERYEDDIINDLIPNIRQNFRVMEPGRSWAVGGFSMGGYGAVKLALKHFKLFGSAFSHSGALEKAMQPKISPVFGDPETDLGFRRSESLTTLTELALCRLPTGRPYLYIDCGASDGLLESNRSFVNHLRFIGYPHEYEELVGYHTWSYFDRAFRTVLPKLMRRIGTV